MKTLPHCVRVSIIANCECYCYRPIACCYFFRNFKKIMQISRSQRRNACDVGIGKVTAAFFLNHREAAVLIFPGISKSRRTYIFSPYTFSFPIFVCYTKIYIYLSSIRLIMRIPLPRLWGLYIIRNIGIIYIELTVVHYGYNFVCLYFAARLATAFPLGESTSPSSPSRTTTRY